MIDLRKLGYLAQRLVLSMTSIIFVLLISEGGATVAARASGRQRTMAFDSRLGWRLLPNVTKRSIHEVQAYTIQTNLRGLRDRNYSYDKPANIFRVVVLGDSQTFGFGGVEAPETFSKQLESALTAVQVINMGVPAFSTDQEYLYLEEGLKYHPDLVIMAVYANDFVMTFRSWDDSIGLPKCYFTLENGRLVYHAPQASLFYKLSRWSYLSEILVNRFRSLRQGRAWRAAPNLSRMEKGVLFARLLTAMDDACKSRGAGFVAMYIPSKSQRTNLFLQDVLVQTGAKNGFIAIDLTGSPGLDEAAYFQRDIHLNERGHTAVARAIRSVLGAEIAALR